MGRGVGGLAGWHGGEQSLLRLTCALLLPQKGDDLEEGVTSEGMA